MDIDSFIQSLEERLAICSDNVLRITDAEIASLSPSEIPQLQNYFVSKSLMYLPEKETAFFEWLKVEDRAVWNDLWNGENDPYIVSWNFLDHLTSESNGFPICDLENVDNYYFTERHIKIPDGINALQDIIQKITNHTNLTIGEALLYEAYCSPIDLWHFCYRYTLPLKAAKKAVEELDHAALLVHLTKHEDLIDYINL